MVKELRQPLAVLDVGLPPRHLLHVPGVAEEQRERVLEDVPDRLPIDARRLHGDVRDALVREPFAERFKIARRRAERPHGGAMPALRTRSRYPDAGDDVRLMHVQAGTEVEDYVHTPPNDRQGEGAAAIRGHSASRARGAARARLNERDRRHRNNL